MKVRRMLPSGALIALLSLMLIYSREFEIFMYDIFETKTQTGSRTPLLVLFTEHLKMVVVSGVIAVALGLAIGIFISSGYGREYRDAFEEIISLGQAFPSAALLALVVPVVGYGSEGALIALVIYALMPIVYNTYAGLTGVDPDCIEAARGMGMEDIRIFTKIRLPLAANVILAGIRTSLVINISAATLAAAVGAGGLGVLVVNGVKAFDPVLILEGAIPVSLMAVIADLVMKEIERKLSYS
ncbi:ABC transporter permease [Youngiibacter fragilis]|uniref:ABC transporter n=1 Tax=Youngiibacter fragilis 232.1 TaxID=994573 RepID=V7I6Z6_9CLOT|nr:ABC transporter permease [Youngiibacter fragilis]ETA80777.1 ABC transporter [Youngiibacter fragilis 232.1]